ncbi:MAG: hypothetical protein HQK53_05005 [Oligoflexia bacterium]|nr:hypothetical protein [Oligoflexia bacterium]
MKKLTLTLTLNLTLLGLLTLYYCQTLLAAEIIPTNLSTENCESLVNPEEIAVCQSTREGLSPKGVCSSEGGDYLSSCAIIKRSLSDNCGLFDKGGREIAECIALTKYYSGYSCKHSGSQICRILEGVLAQEEHSKNSIKYYGKNSCHALFVKENIAVPVCVGLRQAIAEIIQPFFDKEDIDLPSPFPPSLAYSYTVGPDGSSGNDNRTFIEDGGSNDSERCVLCEDVGCQQYCRKSSFATTQTALDDYFRRIKNELSARENLKVKLRLKIDIKKSFVNYLQREFRANFLRNTYYQKERLWNDEVPIDAQPDLATIVTRRLNTVIIGENAADRGLFIHDQLKLSSNMSLNARKIFFSVMRLH